MSKKKKIVPATWRQIDDQTFRVLKRYGSEHGWKIGIKDWVRIGQEGSGVVIANMTTRGMRMTVVSCGGDLISEWMWRENEPSVPLVLLSWIGNHLVTVGEDGCLIIHNVFGEEHSRIPLTHRSQAAGQPILHTFHNHSSGTITVVTDNYLITIDIPDLRFAGYDPVAALPSVRPIPSAIGSGRNVQRIISDTIFVCSSGSVVAVVRTASREISSIGSLQCVHACASEDYIAMVVMSQSETDFTALRVLAIPSYEVVLDMPLASKPSGIAWCGDNLIMTMSDIGIHEHQVLGVSLEQATTTVLSEYKSEHCVVSPHHNNDTSSGVVILHDHGCDLLETLAAEVYRVVSPTSTAVGNKLYRASLLHSKGVYPQALKLIRSLVNERSLYRAINQCLIAALHDLSIDQQKQFLEAAAFGRTYCPEHDVGVLGSTCADVRLLNSVRAVPYCLDITYSTYASDEYQKHNGILQALLCRKLYPLAISICEYAGVPSSEVIISWAIQQVHTNASDEAIVELISVQVSEFPGLSIKPVFEAAIRQSRYKLALLLLDLEPLLSERVLRTLELGEPVRALRIATEANDSDLALKCILLCRKKLEKSEFFHILRGDSDVHRLYQTYCEQRDATGLIELHNEMVSPHQLGLWCLRTALFDRRVTLDIRSRAKELAKAKAYFTQNGKPSEPEARLLADQLRLEDKQQQLRDQNVAVGPHCSVADTIKLLIVDKKYKEADTLAKNMGMSEKNYWFVKLKTLCAQRRFPELEKWAAGGDSWTKALTQKLSTTPISFKHFVNECLKAGNPKEASKYISRITDYGMKAEAYCDCDMIDEAIKVCQNNNDPEILLAVRCRVDKEDAPTLLKIDEIYAHMTGSA
eukprot:TRINITY_DN7596_c0_g1_i1.p1 TRINITY_DN7596_c0_g1~~TRINITY_DN7596_c0_g1_i1.p1  ORF type:complete len:865 (+),score=153.52 TRINITY_DN7596_c0_g1_i1:33-2627(+)